jgi:hypothetical protein
MTDLTKWAGFVWGVADEMKLGLAVGGSAVEARGRRRLNVLWAMLRDHAVYQLSITTAAA